MLSPVFLPREAPYTSSRTNPPHSNPRLKCGVKKRWSRDIYVGKFRAVRLRYAFFDPGGPSYVLLRVSGHSSDIYSIGVAQVLQAVRGKWPSADVKLIVLLHHSMIPTQTDLALKSQKVVFFPPAIDPCILF